MSQLFIGKGYFYTTWPAPCLHCGGPIKFRPLPLGISESNGHESITVCVGFCSWPCMRTYADQNYRSDLTEALTTNIMREFKSACDEHDDGESWRFLQNYDRFSQIPRAPPRHMFAPYGPLSYTEFRGNWISKPAIGGVEHEFSASQTKQMESPIADTYVGPQHVFRRACSTKRQGRPGLSLTHGRWMQEHGWIDPPSS